MAIYKGLYVQRLSNGTIIGVQVENCNGMSLPLNPGAYVERGISPPIEMLPNRKVSLNGARPNSGAHYQNC